MRQTTKKNKIPTYWVIQLLSIVFLLNVVQCKCDKGKGVEDPKLSLAVYKIIKEVSLKAIASGSETKVSIPIKNSKSRKEFIVSLKQGSSEETVDSTKIEQEPKVVLGHAIEN